MDFSFAVGIAMPMLHPADLLQLATCSRSCQVQLTHKTVLTSVLCCGDKHVRLEAVMNLLLKVKIFLPSPLRLLRLAEGRKCELCLGKLGQGKRPPYERYGALLCKACANPKRSTLGQKDAKVERIQYTKAWDFALKHARTTDRHKPTIWHLFSKAHSQNGERCGPVITVETVDRIVSDVQGDEWKERMEGGVSTCQAERAAALETFMVGAVGENASERASQLVELYKGIKPAATDRRNTDVKRKADKKLEKAATKRQKYETAMESIRLQLGEVWWKDLAMESRLLRLHTRHFESAPSSVSPKRLKGVADVVIANFSLLPRAFVDGSFLGNDGFEVAYRTFISDETKRRKNLEGIACWHLGNDPTFTAAITTGRLGEALFYSVYNSQLAQLPRLAQLFAATLPPANDSDKIDPCHFWDSCQPGPFQDVFQPLENGNPSVSDLIRSYESLPALFNRATALFELGGKFVDYEFPGDTMFERTLCFAMFSLLILRLQANK
jgi:hypothetical protein